MIGIIILLLTNYLAGFSLYRLFFRNTNLLEKILVPQILSLLVTPALFVILYVAVGFDAAVYLLPLVIVSLFVASLRMKQKTEKIAVDRKWLAVAVMAALAVMISASFYNLSFYPRFEDTNSHISVANFIKDFKTLPPEIPGMFGVMSNYQWFYHLMLSLVSVYSGVPVLGLLSFFTVYAFVLFTSTAFLLGRTLFKGTAMSLLFTSILAVFFSQYYYVPQTQGYAMALTTLFFYVFMKFLEKKENRFAALSGAIAAGMMYIHGHSFIFLGLTIVSYALYRLVFDRKSIVMNLACMMAPLALILPYMFIVGGFVGSLFLFEPLGGLIMNYPLLFSILLVPLPLGIYKSLKSKDTVAMVFISLLITLFTFVGMFLMQKVPDIYRYEYFMIFPVLFLSLNFIEGLSPFIKKIFAVLAFAIFLYPFLNAMRPVIASQNFLNSDVYVASTWIKDNTNKDSTILTAPASLYTALTERRIILREPITLATLGVNPTEHFSDVLLLYTSPSQDLIEKYNVSYVVLGDMESSFFYKYDIAPFNFSSSQAFEKVYSYGNYTVYNVSYKGVLPKYFDPALKSQQNFTSYSRWWSI